MEGGEGVELLRERERAGLAWSDVKRGGVQEAWPFMDPVDPIALGVSNYFEVIKRPMDLGSIKTKLHNNTYAKVSHAHTLAHTDDFHAHFNKRLAFQCEGDLHWYIGVKYIRHSVHTPRLCVCVSDTTRAASSAP